MSQVGFQDHINSMFQSYLDNPNSIEIITDCAKFQFFLMLKYYESTGQRFTYTGKNGKRYDSHATKKNGDYVYNDFNSFFQRAKLGISTHFLIYESENLVEKKSKGLPAVNGDMLIDWYGKNGHASGIVFLDNVSYMFYGSGSDSEPENCLTCKTAYYPMYNANYENAANRYSWKFLSNLPYNLTETPQTEIPSTETEVEDIDTGEN
jgi:hypothetical protein